MYYTCMLISSFNVHVLQIISDVHFYKNKFNFETKCNTSWSDFEVLIKFSWKKIFEHLFFRISTSEE